MITVEELVRRTFQEASTPVPGMVIDTEFRLVITDELRAFVEAEKEKIRKELHDAYGC